MNSSNRYQLVESIYQRTVDLPPERRAAFLARECNGDDGLLREIESLIEHFERAEVGFLEQPIHQYTFSADRSSMPAQIGRYEIIRMIGEGGMGVVYEARQQSPRRTVALKVIRSQWPTRDTLRRFRHECQILGQLQHPGIAQIFESDVADVETSTGASLRQPYFVMEYIRGRRLDSHIRENGLNTSKRLELVARICDAVQYAHLKGVIHRDLKPGNILIDERDQPKILDFGVSRVTGSDLQTLTMPSSAGQLLGTLAYMSPEQVAGNPLEVDTRADVYSLGVVLYQALCGRLPLDVSGKSIPDAARMICDEKPLLISSVDPSLRSEIPTICAKALEKDKTRRYQSAGDLADDIRRYLRGEPIDAKRDSTAYMLRKTLRRYRWQIAALCIFIAMLGAFATYAMIQAGNYQELALREEEASHQARASEQSAVAAAFRADAVKGFLQDMLAAADPTRAGGRNLTVREVLDDASERIATGLLAIEPAVEAEVRATIAHTYFNLGLNGAAIPHYQWISDYRRREFGPASVDTINSLCWLGRAHVESPSPEPSLPIYERAVAMALEALGPEHEATLAAMDGLGEALMRLRRTEEAEDLHQDVLDGVQRVLSDEHELFVSTTLNLGRVYSAQRRLDEAERLYTKALDGADRLHGRKSRVSVRIRWLLASEIYARTDRLDLAEKMLNETLTDARSGLGPDHPETMIVLTNLSRVMVLAGREEDAEKLLRDAVENLDEIRAIEGNDTIKAVGELALLLSRQGKHDEATTLLRDGIDKARQLPEYNGRVLSVWMDHLAQAEARSGNFIAAVGTERELLELRKAYFGARNRHVARSLHRLGLYYGSMVSFNTGPVEQCLDAHRRAVELFHESQGETHIDTTYATREYSAALIRQREYETAENLMRERLELLSLEVGKTDTGTSSVANSLAYILQFDGREAEAAAVCRRMLQLYLDREPNNHVQIARWWYRLGISLYLSSDYIGANEAFQHAVEEDTVAERPVSVAVHQARQAEALIAMRRIQEATDLAENAVPVLRAGKGDRHKYTWMAVRTLAHALIERGDLKEAESHLRDCVEALESSPLTLTESQMEVGRAKSVLGKLLTRMGRFSEAEQVLFDAYEKLNAACGETHGFVRAARRRLAALYEAWNRPAEAEQWRQSSDASNVLNEP